MLLIRRLRAGKSREGWEERWGRVRVPEIPPGPRIWFHAASVGEVAAAIPVIRALKTDREDLRIIFTVITPGGYESACAHVGKLIDSVHYAPFDAPWAAGRTVREIEPAVLVVMETEIWPNMLHYTRRFGARAILINGRISDRSFPKYLLARGLFAWALGRFDRILVQTTTDMVRFVALGGQRVTVGGNTKFDEEVKKLSSAESAELRRALRIPDDSPVLVAGSTRVAEEEEMLFRAYNRVRESAPDLVLIHAPRHVDRAQQVVELMRANGLQPVRKTQIESASGPASHLVLDTFGELASVYGIAHVAFIGNSLVAPGGGQNLLQPLAHGKPTVYGPYMQNFRDLAATAESAGVGFRVNDEDELASTLSRLLANREQRAAIDHQARALIAENRGAAERYAAEILSLLGERR